MDDKTKPPNVAALIKNKRLQLGWSQEKLAESVGTKQQTIEKIERGITKNSSFTPRILSVLGEPLDLLTRSPKVPVSLEDDRPQPLFGSKDLPVHGAAMGGDGALIMTTDPVECVARPHPLLNVPDGYGVIVVEDSMVPEFESGDIALIHPHLPPRAGRTCVFYSHRPDGAVLAQIKRLRRFTDDLWYIQQFNPKRDSSLKRSEWQTCHVTVGKYTHR